MNNTVKADTGHFVLFPSVTTTSSDSVTTTIARTSGFTGVSGTGTAGNLSNKNIANAVYGHIRAVRALGKTTVDSHEIARALNLSPAQVAQALTQL
jgi:hypothetical protein